MRLIDAAALKYGMVVIPTTNGNKTAWAVTEQNIEKAPTVEAIPIAVIKHAIAGISAADQCDQAGRYERELRDALNKVLEWYGSPGYQEHAKRAAHG